MHVLDDQKKKIELAFPQEASIKFDSQNRILFEVDAIKERLHFCL